MERLAGMTVLGPEMVLVGRETWTRQVQRYQALRSREKGCGRQATAASYVVAVAAHVRRLLHASKDMPDVEGGRASRSLSI